MNALGRGGVVIAMSSGLVATMTLPAQAVGQNAVSPEVTSPLPAAAPAGAAFSSGSLAGPSVLEAAAPMTAPAAAKVTFETGTFKALPKPKPKPEPRRVTTVDDSPGTSRDSSDSSSSSSSDDDDGGSFGGARGSSVLSVAARYVGTPYRYGGTTPGGFDCSGYTRYVYAQLGIYLPRTAHQQMLATTRVSRSNARPGDLVFVVSGGRATHVGIYAGNNMMYDSPRSGKTLAKRKIWSSSVLFGRV